MQTVTAISAVPVSQNSIGVRGEAEQSGEKSFEATLREVEGAESTDQPDAGSQDTTADLPVEGVLQGRQALRQRVRRPGTEQGSTAPQPDATQSVQALLGGLLGDTMVGAASLSAETQSVAGENVTNTGMLEAAVGFVGEIIKPAVHVAPAAIGHAEAVSGPAVLGAGATPDTAAVTDLGESLAGSGMIQANKDQLAVVQQLVQDATKGAAPREAQHDTPQVLAQTEAVAAAPRVAAQLAVQGEEIATDTDTDADASPLEVAPTQSVQHPLISTQTEPSVPSVQSSGVATSAAPARSSSDASMVDAAKAAWQGLEMQRIGRNVAASIQTAHGEIAVVAQVAHGETHMLAELPSSLVQAMSEQVQGELRRELHDNGIRAGEMEFRQSDQEPHQQRRADDQREEAEHGWS
jgi:hypothetical protein